MPDRREDDAIEPQDPPSKSARKRQMLGLQAVGESLLSLNDNQLSKIPIDDERLLSAIRECRQIRSNSARKRHLQLIGKIMRNIDPAPIEQALAALHNTKQES
ncbi:MAG: ribosome biogenesis factor YjgA, partial [Halioglobus sp.]